VKRYSLLVACGSLLAVGLITALAACGANTIPSPRVTDTPVRPRTAAPALPPPTQLRPTPTPAPDVNIPLENRLDASWQRADVAWSPDSRNIAVTYWAGWRTQTFLIDARTSETLDLTTEDGLDVGLVAWSPDGKKLAAIAGTDMDTERYGVWLFAGGRQIHLLDGACEDLAWSPDSAVLLATCELYYWGSAPPPLDQSPEATRTASQLGGVWGGGQLWKMVIEDGDSEPEPQRLLDLVQLPLVTFGSGTRYDTARHATWSPDGQRVAFEVRSEDKALALKMGIAVAGAGGAPRLVTNQPVWLVGWLPDGKLLVRSNVFGGQIVQYTDDLYALDLATGQAENLTRVDPHCDPLQNPRCQGARRQILDTPGYAVLSPDSRRYYYRATGRSDVIGSPDSVDYVVEGTYPPSDLALEYSAAHAEPDGARLLYPAWLAGGRLAYVNTTGYDPQTWTVPDANVTVQFVIDGKVVRQEDVGTWGVFAVGWSPDGRRAAVATDFGVIVYGLP
jgi:dipeptidyl aminopeptidase/acylaminoacyl peptidase